MAEKIKPKRLGRGLDAIFNIEDIAVKDNSPVLRVSEWEVEVSKIRPNPTQPRTQFDEAELQDLASSIKVLGIIQPLTLRKESDGTYTIISGERRFRASQIAGLTSVPAYIRTASDNDMLEMALVENIQRADLNALEIAITLQRLVDECRITQEQLAERVGKKRSTVSNYIRLLKLPAEVQSALRDGEISMGHARAIISVDSPVKQKSILKRVIKNSLSVRQTEELVKSLLEGGKKSKESVLEEEYPESYTRLVEHLEKFFNQDISIKKSNKGDGKIIINFKNDEEINNILSKFEFISE